MGKFNWNYSDYANSVKVNAISISVQKKISVGKVQRKTAWNVLEKKKTIRETFVYAKRNVMVKLPLYLQLVSFSPTGFHVWQRFFV